MSITYLSYSGSVFFTLDKPKNRVRLPSTAENSTSTDIAEQLNT